MVTLKMDSPVTSKRVYPSSVQNAEFACVYVCVWGGGGRERERRESERRERDTGRLAFGLVSEIV